MSKTLIENMVPGIKPTWRLSVDGMPVPWNQRIELVHDRFGTINVGKSPSGTFDQWAFHESGGGGSVIVPYAVLQKGDLLIGVLQQKRPLQDAEVPVWNVPRGFMAPGETPFQTAGREFGEEVGQLPEGMVPHELCGDPVNPNSTFFETWGKRNGGTQEGITFFGIRFPERLLRLKHWNDGAISEAAIADGVIVVDEHAKAAKLAESILGVSFFPWHETMRVGDAFTVMGTGRVLATLKHIR